MRTRTVIGAMLLALSLAGVVGCSKSEDASASPATSDGKAPGASDAGLSTAQGAARRGAPGGP